MNLSTYAISQRSIALADARLRAAGIGPLHLSSEHRIHRIWKSPHGGDIKIQVKGNAAPKPGGGRGKLALDWWIDEDSPADVIALVDLSTERVWLMNLDEVRAFAQQHSGRRYHLYMYVDPTAVLRRGNYDTDFQAHLLDRKLALLFSPA